MARFEKGTGERKRSVTINQLGALLTRDEIEGTSERLTGYWQLHSETDARSAFVREALELISEGLKPVDQAAKDIAKLVPKRSKEGASTMPLRSDLFVYNEATGMMITTRRMAGKYLEEGSSKWKKAVVNGDIIPVSLIQDDPFVVRVVVGGELQEAERDQWVSRLDGYLNAKDGKLCITGGAVLVSEDYDADDSYFENYVRQLEIPKGHYRVSLYTYVPGVNGMAVIDHVAGKKAEPVGSWFRRTRKPEPFPAWLREWCTADPSLDPGHEKEWRNAKSFRGEESSEYVHFLLHLEPVTERPSTGLSPLPEDGWFGEAVNGRVPAKCPLGLAGVEVTGRQVDSNPQWTFAYDVFKLVGARKLTSIGNHPLKLKIEELGLLYRLAWFSTRWSIPGIRATLSADAESINWLVPEGVVAVPSGKCVDFVFSSDIYGEQLVAAIENLAKTLSTLPNGSVLELVTSPIETHGNADPLVGYNWFRGPVRDGCWEINATFPPVESEILEDALQLAREVRSGKELSLKSPSESEAVLAWAKTNFSERLDDNPPSVIKLSLRLKKQDPAILALYGVAAFAVRFSDTWPVVVLNNAEEDTDEDSAAEVRSATPGKPIWGKEVYRAPSGRAYYATMALLISESLADRIQEEEKGLRQLKFTHLSDIVCDKFPNMAVRAYRSPAAQVWGILVVGAPNTMVLELSSRFTDGALLVTTRNAGACDFPQRKIYRQPDATSSLEQLLEKHLARLRELEAKHGKAIEIVVSSEGFAEYVEKALVQQYG